MNGLPAIQTK